MPQTFFHPHSLMSWGESLLPWGIGITALMGTAGLVLGLAVSPPDYHQGEIMRIMYIHVPTSWGALCTYTVMALLSAWGLIARTSFPHLLARSIAPAGIAFTLVSLGTGAIWGKPAWGVWWVWDARLTSMLLLLFLYLGYWFLARAGEDEEKALSAGAVVAVVGCINIPVIKWSVEWWHTLHQPASVLRFARPAIHWTMMAPLMCMAIALAAWGFSLTIIRLRTELTRRKIRALELRASLDNSYGEAA